MEGITIQTFDKPRDLYIVGCTEIYDCFANYGFKFLKNGPTLKKSDSLFNYNINFSSSHYNCIDADKNNGHVQLDFWCSIESKKSKNRVYHIMQRSSFGMGVYHYELFSKGGVINENEIKSACEFIESKFIPVIQQFENNSNTLLEKACHTPAEDFGEYNYKFEKELFLILGREDLLIEYQKNIEEFNNSYMERHYKHWKQHILTKFDMDYCNVLVIDDLKSILKQIYDDVHERIGVEIPVGDNKFLQDWITHYNRLMGEYSMDRTDWIADYLLFIINMMSYKSIQDEVLKEELVNFRAKFIRL